MKKIRFAAMAVILLLTAGLASCGHDTDEGSQSAENSSKSEPVSTAEINTDSTDAPTAETEALLDENVDFLFISEEELPTNLKNKIYELLRAAAVHDEEAYLDAFDIEAYAKAKYNYSETDPDFESQCINIRDEQVRNFQELSEAFVGGFRESIENVYIEDNGGTYYLSFTTDADNGKLSIMCDAYQDGDTWGTELYLWSVIDYAYYEYEPLILEELIAAAQGDKEAYLNCVDVEMANDVNAAMHLDGDDPSAIDEEAKSRTREVIEDICDISFEELSDMLGENFDGRILEVQFFAKVEDITIPNGELYGRIALTVRDSENEFQAVVGYAYTINGKKGVWLLPGYLT